MFEELVQSLTSPWAFLGLAGQSCFFLRFLIQWLLSEKRGASVVPRVFWYISLCGAVLMLVYAVKRRDGVIALGQVMAFLVYFRNLILIHRSGPTNVS